MNRVLIVMLLFPAAAHAETGGNPSLSDDQVKAAVDYMTAVVSK